MKEARPKQKPPIDFLKFEDLGLGTHKYFEQIIADFVKNYTDIPIRSLAGITVDSIDRDLFKDRIFGTITVNAHSAGTSLFDLVNAIDNRLKNMPVITRDTVNNKMTLHYLPIFISTTHNADVIFNKAVRSNLPFVIQINPDITEWQDVVRYIETLYNDTIRYHNLDLLSAHKGAKSAGIFDSSKDGVELVTTLNPSMYYLS